MAETANVADSGHSPQSLTAERRAPVPLQFQFIRWVDMPLHQKPLPRKEY